MILSFSLHRGRAFERRFDAYFAAFLDCNMFAAARSRATRRDVDRLFSLTRCCLPLLMVSSRHAAALTRHLLAASSFRGAIHHAHFDEGIRARRADFECCSEMMLRHAMPRAPCQLRRGAPRRHCRAAPWRRVSRGAALCDAHLRHRHL